MVETDWREILSFSQKELKRADKEKICESLCWMESDDIELNFTDLKTLFRLAQDILKYKSEQVNNLLGELESTQRKNGKSKSKHYFESPNTSPDSVMETLTHQEEEIKANKEILEQLYSDIAQLEGRKSKLEEEKHNIDKDSESSRDALSEMNAIAQLENDIFKKNRHIRKLLSDVKSLEEENSKLKDKLSVFKDKLKEATQVIENLTEQLFTVNNECRQLKDVIGKSEQSKSQLSLEIESLKTELTTKNDTKVNIQEIVKSKLQHFKAILKSNKSEIDRLSAENTKLKEDLIQASKPAISPKKDPAEDIKNEELQKKLAEASNEIIQSANLICILKAENKQLKSLIEEIPDQPISDSKNESDDGKERKIILKLTKQVKSLTAAIHSAEEMVALRERELTEITSQLQLLQSEEGLSELLNGIKNKKRQLKIKNEGIKSLINEINILNEIVDDLQIQNEAMRQRLNLSPEDKVPTKGILKKIFDLQQNHLEIGKELRETTNKLVLVEIDNRLRNSQIDNLINLLEKAGYNKNEIYEICMNIENDPEELNSSKSHRSVNESKEKTEMHIQESSETKAIIEENEGLRKGLNEILNFLKDNSTTSSGILTIECPSLEALLRSLEARHAAGWFAPHMSTVMELRAALGGKDALLTALHESRKDTFNIIKQLSVESKKSLDLEKKLQAIERDVNTDKKECTNKETPADLSIGEFGSWMSESEWKNVNFNDSTQIQELISKGSSLYEYQLKYGLQYFHKKFTSLYDKLTTLAVNSADNQNKWSIQEEHYKAVIENLKAQCHQVDEDDRSDVSPGLINHCNDNFLHRKCTYLEALYIHLRTSNENMKNELLESKREAMLLSSTYETDIQSLVLTVIDLSDKLRHCVPLELFWKQNNKLNEYIGKYRSILNKGVLNNIETIDLYKRLRDDKASIINYFQNRFKSESFNEKSKINNILSNVEQSVLQKQLYQICTELESKNKEIDDLNKKNLELQNNESKLIHQILSSTTKEQTSEKQCLLEQANRSLKLQCQQLQTQLDVSLLQLQDNQKRYMNNDIEINMLRHQILDLQSVGDNKAIIARLSGEILMAHLQVSESQASVERIKLVLNKEKQMKAEAEEMLRGRQKTFDIYTSRYENKFRNMCTIMEILKEQYHGSLPLFSLENYLNTVEEFHNKSYAANEKLNDIEDLQSKLMTKHSIYDQILDISKTKCMDTEDNCPHKLKCIIMEKTTSSELEHCVNKLHAAEQSRQNTLEKFRTLEKLLVLLNQGLKKTSATRDINILDNTKENHLELEDIQSEDEFTDNRRSQTFTLPKPQVINPSIGNSPDKNNLDDKVKKNDRNNSTVDLINISTQTLEETEIQKRCKFVQTDEDKTVKELQSLVKNLIEKNELIQNQLKGSDLVSHKYTENISLLTKEKMELKTTIQKLLDSNNEKSKVIQNLHTSVDALQKQLDSLKIMCKEQVDEARNVSNIENQTLLLSLKKIENDKNRIIDEYKGLINQERDEYAKSIQDLNEKISMMQIQSDRRGSSNNATNDIVKNTTDKYTLKVTELEDKCFQLQSNLDNCKTELSTYESEMNRWKMLASERLSKMEQLSAQLKERHSHEVESYKAENQHWLSQLNETQREHMELRTRLTEQKAHFVKQLADKDAHIEQMRSVIHNLKTQIMNMQTMISVNDPSFDLSAIVEVDEVSDVGSYQGSERLELKFGSNVDLQDIQDDFVRIPASSTAIWQESIIERLRREKNMMGKQNMILRRQIKALASRERRSRLDAQNLKNQVFRISTSGNKVTTVESAALHNKIASLQAQLTSARKDSHSNIALWDKWKRAQQASERWQARYEEKCQEVKKLEYNTNLAKSAVTRLEKEKRVLLLKLAELKGDEKQLAIEKQDEEISEKNTHRSGCACDSYPQISARALLERVEAQQRRIVALEVAEKGNEPLISEYEKSLAEITSLKGQVLKLESTLLESQIRLPQKPSKDDEPELDYWKSYCEMLKEENMQLTLRVNSLETIPSSGSQRVNDLEQTVLTLRGLVSKLQADQKSSGTTQKRADSRPGSGISSSERARSQIESHRTEISNLKRSIHEKDLLLERSKEMLKIAAEREDELLRENAYLRHQLHATESKGGFLSA